MRFQNTLLLAAAPVALFAVTAPAFAQTAPAETSEASSENHNAELRAWFDAKYEEQVMDSPLWLTSLGRKERYGEIDDFSLAAQDKDLAWKKATVEEMERTFDYDSLSSADKC